MRGGIRIVDVVNSATGTGVIETSAKGAGRETWIINGDPAVGRQIASEYFAVPVTPSKASTRNASPAIFTGARTVLAAVMSGAP